MILKNIECFPRVGKKLSYSKNKILTELENYLVIFQVMK